VGLVIDSGVLYATLDLKDRRHAACSKLLSEVREERIVPAPVLPEIDWLCRHSPAGRFSAVIEQIGNGALEVEDLNSSDYRRVHELLTTYADLRVGFVDAAVLAVVERLREPKPATLAHLRHAPTACGRARTAADMRSDMDDLPRSVKIREVGPRDGFQNEPETIPTERKVELIDALARTGLRRLEVTSFVRPDVIPQLADAAEVLECVDIPAGVAVSVLVPNARGLDRALALRELAETGMLAKGEHPPASVAVGGAARPAFDEVNVFLSASETHNRRNVNRSIAESLADLEGVLARARGEGLRCEGVISTSFGCPYEGRVPPERVLDIAARLRDAGAQEVGFGDTTGMANPRQVAEFFALAFERLGLDVELTAHFHNTRGAGLANALAALDAGVRSFESSFGELGGCPVPPGATGNIATEDLVSMLHEMGYVTGIDLQALLACAARVQEVLGRRLGSHTLVAGPVEWDERD
jgi:hydroxymethylglutaryl-CoA lyase